MDRELEGMDIGADNEEEEEEDNLAGIMGPHRLP